MANIFVGLIVCIADIINKLYLYYNLRESRKFFYVVIVTITIHILHQYFKPIHNVLKYV